MGMRRYISLGAAAATALLLAGCVPSGPPTVEEIDAEYGTPIEAAWEVEVPGLYGEPVVRDGMAFVYADDDEVGLRLAAYDLEEGELLWEHTASPGGAYANPFLLSQDAAGRPYPLPAIRPTVVERGNGEDAELLVVYFEREIPTEDTIAPDDFLRVVEARSGEQLEVRVPGLDPDEFHFRPLGIHDSGEIFANTLSPARPCGDERLCWQALDEETDVDSATIALDLGTLEATYEPGRVPEADETLIPEWGPGFWNIPTDTDTDVAFFEGAEQRWRAPSDELFGVERTSPADLVDFTRVGDLVLMQGYQPILETLDEDLPHTLSIDFVTSRTLIAVEASTGEVVWRLEGGDMLCHSVHERAIAEDATTIPICVARSGGFVYDVGNDEMLEDDPPVASIAELDIETGELGWEVEHAGSISIAHTGRLLEFTRASRGDLALTEVDDEQTGLLDLRDGEWYPAVEDATFVCRAERPDVELEFEGSTFSGGSNPIATGYPAGWYHFACDVDGGEIDDWSTGAVRVAGYPDRGGDSGMVVLPLEGSLIAFDLEP